MTYPLTGPAESTRGPTPRFVGDLWFCTTTASGFTANSLYVHNGTAWVLVAFAGSSGVGQMSGNVAMNVLNTFFGGPNTGSVGASGQVVLLRGTVSIAGQPGDNVTAKLWDGTNVFDSTEGNIGSGGRLSLSLNGRAAATGAATYEIACANGNNTNGTILAATLENGVGNNASNIVYQIVSQ